MFVRAGTTTKQMQEAPNNAVFVWCTSDLWYPKVLARELGRQDLEIVTPEWLIHRWRGRNFSDIVVDHAARLTRDQVYGLEDARHRIQRRGKSS